MRTITITLFTLLLLTGTLFAVPSATPANLILAANPDYSINAPSVVTVNQGSATAVIVSVSSLNNFTGTVSLTPDVFPHLSNGPLQTLSPSQVSVTPSSRGLSTLTTSTSSSTPAGPYNYTITGSASSGGGFINHTFVGQLVVKASGQPDFTISANPINQTVVAGSSGKSLIILTSVNGFVGIVNLSTSPPPLCASCPGWGLNSSIVKLSSGGTASSTLTFVSTTGTPLRSWVVTVTGTSGSLSHSVDVAFTVVSSSPPPPDFTITANPSSLTIPAGSAATSTITLTSVNGFSGTVSLQTSPPPLCPSPQCSVWSITPTSVNLSRNGTAAATLTILGGTQSSGGNVTVSGTSGSLSHFVVVTFKVLQAQPDFTLTANPSQILAQPGFNATSTITVSALNGFSGTVFFSLSSSPGLLANITPHNVTRTGSATLIVSASTAGNYTTTVTGTSGSLSHSVTLLVNVSSQAKPDFAINANPTNLTIAAGSSGSSVITLTSLNGFNGTVTLTDTVSSTVIIATLSRTSIPLPPGGSGSSALTVTTTTSTPPGSYFVTVTGSSGSLSHSAFVFVSVTGSAPPSFSLSANPTRIIIARGSSGTSNINVTSLNNFSGTVSLTSSSSTAGLATSLNPSSITLVGGGTANSILTISTTSVTATGNYTVTVTGTGGSLSRAVTIFVTVTAPPPPPDFTITVSPTSRSVSRGSSTSFTIAVTGTNGFNSTVSLAATVSPLQRHGPTTSLPSTVGPYSTSTLTVSTSRQTSVGTYTITITATSGSLTHTVTVTVTVTR